MTSVVMTLVDRTCYRKVALSCILFIVVIFTIFLQAQIKNPRNNISCIKFDCCRFERVASKKPKNVLAVLLKLEYPPINVSCAFHGNKHT